MASGLSESELVRVTSLLGRIPNELEKGIFGAMWSEHCSYKSSKDYLRKLPKTSPRVLVGPGENAGAVDIGDGLCVVFKVESHNHPSYIEPFQGAATGVGGILRDIFTMGARPFATMNLLRFGSQNHPKTPQLVEGTTRGLSSYGNCFGVANVASDVAFDACYDGNILVNAFAIGLCKHEELQSGTAHGDGNVVIYVGAKTGRDGIHGATMASESFGDNAKAKRPTVQVGDPFKEKLLLEACLECFEKNLVIGIQDMGAAGLTSSSYEMATRGESGLDLHLDRVPLRDSKMTPYEIMLSESQERMLLVASVEKAEEIKSIFTRYGLDAVVIGQVTTKKTVDLYWHKTCVSSLKATWLTDDAPIEKRETCAPTTIKSDATLKSLSTTEKALKELFEEREKAAHFEQYDRHIGLFTLSTTSENDAALLRIPGTSKVIALTIGCDQKLCAVDPCEGARRTFARQILQLACVGASPIGITNCLNFGSPEDKTVMWQFSETIDGLVDAALNFGVPVVSGNVSLYNQTNECAIYPTPTLCVVGLREGFSKSLTRNFKRAGDTVLFIGNFVNSSAMSERSRRAWDLKEVKELAQTVEENVLSGLIDTACCVAEGGIAGTLLRMCSEYNFSGQIEELYSEDSMGIVVSIQADKVESLKRELTKFSVHELGVTKPA